MLYDVLLVGKCMVLTEAEAMVSEGERRQGLVAFLKGFGWVVRT